MIGVGGSRIYIVYFSSIIGARLPRSLAVAVAVEAPVYYDVAADGRRYIGNGGGRAAVLRRQVILPVFVFDFRRFGAKVPILLKLYFYRYIKIPRLFRKRITFHCYLDIGGKQRLSRGHRP